MKKSKQNSFIIVAGLFLSIAAISSASIFIRFAQSEAPSIVISAYRMALSALILMPFCLPRALREFRRLSFSTVALIFLSGLFLALHFASWVTSLNYTSVASSVVLVTTTPLWVAILSPFFLDERISRSVVVGLIVALVGSAIVGLSSGCTLSMVGFHCEAMTLTFQGKAFWGNLLALAGAFLCGGYLMVGRKVRDQISLSSYLFAVYFVAAVILLILAGITGEKLIGYTVPIYVWMIALAVIPQIIGHSIFNWGLKYLSATYVSITLLGEPVGTVILAMIFLKESPTILELVGGGLILAGILVASYVEKTALIPENS